MPSLARPVMTAMLAAGVMGAALTGCGSQQTAPAQEHLPRLTELSRAQDSADSDSFDHGVVAVASVVRIWLPGHLAIEELWKDTALHVLSEAELEHWRANQLTAAVMNRVDIPAFLQKLSANYGIRQQMITLAYELSPLEPANPRQAQQLAVVDIQGMRETTGKGQLQFLLAADAQSGDWVKLTMLPHLHQPRVSLLPRTHVEAALDGRMYSELMLRALLTPGKVLLVAPSLPAQVFDDTPPEEIVPAPQPVDAVVAGAAATSQPVEQVLEIPPPTTGPTPVPAGLGRALLTGSLGQAPLQQLLLIEVQKVMPQTTRPADTTPGPRP